MKPKDWILAIIMILAVAFLIGFLSDITGETR
jgi:hypothetical protein